MSNDLNITEMLVQIANEINASLVEAGDRINSVNDLERVFEGYSGKTINIPDLNQPVSNEPAQQNSDSESVSISKSTINSNTEGANGSFIIFPFFGLVNCLGVKVDHVHNSSKETGALHGKSHGFCIVLIGPRDITFQLFASITILKKYLIFEFFQPIAIKPTPQQWGEYASWSQSDTLVSSPCIFDGTYRGEVGIYTSSDTLGMYFPYPIVITGPITRLTC